VWASDKWKGVFKVRWIFVRDIPNVTLRHIKLLCVLVLSFGSNLISFKGIHRRRNLLQIREILKNCSLMLARRCYGFFTHTLHEQPCCKTLPFTRLAHTAFEFLLHIQYNTPSGDSKSPRRWSLGLTSSAASTFFPSTSCCHHL
jgi:hypothetical protein